MAPRRKRAVGDRLLAKRPDQLPFQSRLLAQGGPAVRLIGANAHAQGNQAARAWDYEYERDHRWFRRLKRQVTANQPGWTLVLVGGLHCTNADEHTLWRLLRASGRDCRRLFPCIRPPIAWG